MGDVGHPTITSFRADELRRRRIHAGLTQQAAAKRMGVSAWTFRQWELGHHAPRAERLPVLAAVLSCDPSDLVAPPQTLADLRTLAGRTQADLAKILGVSRVVVSQWEQGLMPVAAKHHTALATALGVPTEDLPLA